MAAAAAEEGYGAPGPALAVDGDFDFDLDFDLDAMLAAFAGDGEPSSGLVQAVAQPSIPLDAAESLSPASVTSDPPVSAAEIERFLMADIDGEGDRVKDFDADEFFDAVFDASEGGERSEEQGSEEDAGGNGHNAMGVAAAEVEGDDPISRKRKRQIRNRDSAMKSRERKRAYVKDLEAKNKYLEAECRRLSYALQCFTAENLALRQSLLQRPSAIVRMQESAVLFSELLPLGSLHLLVDVVVLLLLLLCLLPNQGQAGAGERRHNLATRAAPASEEDSVSGDLCAVGSAQVILRRSCKGSRTRMKEQCLFALRFPMLDVC